jgi:mannose-6-phosphate isomerase-like protein (cupin superfamily)
MKLYCNCCKQYVERAEIDTATHPEIGKMSVCPLCDEPESFTEAPPDTPGPVRAITAKELGAIKVTHSKPNIVEKDWGTEEIIVNEPTHCGKILRVNAGWQCSFHHHEKKDETFYVQNGPVVMQVDAAVMIAYIGSSFRIPPGTPHLFAAPVLTRSNHVVQLFEFSSHHDDEDVVRHEPSKPISDVLKLRFQEYCRRDSTPRRIEDQCDTMDKVLDYLRANPGTTVHQVAKALGEDGRAMATLLYMCYTSGQVTRVKGMGPKGGHGYSIVEESADGSGD